mgnify:CR=1 FL=1
MEKTAKKILSERGHKNIVTVTLPKGHVNDLHDHPFDADTVIIAGSIKIVVSDKVYNLKPGDEFQFRIILSCAAVAVKFDGGIGAVY